MHKILPFLFFLFVSLVVHSQDPIRINTFMGMAPGSTMAVYGDMYANETAVTLNGEVHINTVSSLIKSPGNITIYDLVINSQEFLTLETELFISDLVEFNSGVVLTDRSLKDNYLLHFLDNTSYSGLSDATYVDGTVGKTGDDSFIFPIGHNYRVNTLAITDPLSTDTYKTYFLQNNIADIISTSSTDECVSVIDDQGYWLYERSSGTDDVIVDLSYSPDMLADDVQCNNVVASYDGSTWTSEGNGGISGSNTTGGYLQSGTGCQSCGTEQEVFNYGFLTIAAPFTQVLPVSWLGISGKWIDFETTEITWELATEFNNAYFIIQRSDDAVNWDDIARVESLGNTSSYRSYNFLDTKLNESTQFFYRVQQVDVDGKSSEFSQIIFLQRPDGIKNQGISVFPNPASDFIYVKANQEQVGYKIRLINAFGQVILESELTDKTKYLNVADLISGIYILELFDPASNQIQNTLKINKL